MVNVTNLFGGNQQQVLANISTVPQDALVDVARITTAGAKKYGEDNWRLITTDEHLNHALMHLALYLLGDKEEEHLSNATCRLMFARAVTIDDFLIFVARAVPEVCYDKEKFGDVPDSVIKETVQIFCDYYGLENTAQPHRVRAAWSDLMSRPRTNRAELEIFRLKGLCDYFSSRIADLYESLQLGGE